LLINTGGFAETVASFR